MESVNEFTDYVGLIVLSAQQLTCTPFATNFKTSKCNSA